MGTCVIDVNDMSMLLRFVNNPSSGGRSVTFVNRIDNIDSLVRFDIVGGIVVIEFPVISRLMRAEPEKNAAGIIGDVSGAVHFS